jgi:hypothetical protein
MTKQERKMYSMVQLTNYPPVRVHKYEWPIIATSTYRKWDAHNEFQSNRITRWELAVRQHKNGCALIYGMYKHSSTLKDERAYNVRAGEVLEPSGDLIAAIRRVGSCLESQEHCPGDASRWGMLIEKCIYRLPIKL